MNILFYTPFRVSEQKGGTERITARISTELRKRGHRCFAAYGQDIGSDFQVTDFDDSINFSKSSLFNFLVDKKIEVIVFQIMTREVKKIKEFVVSRGLQIKIISVLHFNPGYEEMKISFSLFLKQLISDRKLSILLTLEIVRVCLYPFYRIFYPQRNKGLYRTVYSFSDRVVVLSKSFVNEFVNYASLKDKSKFCVIPNALSYDEYAGESIILRKKRQVLIVSRLEEPQKRISTSIKIWKKIEEDVTLKDWHLVIVGTGGDEKNYKKLVRKLHLDRITFCGRQDPKSYYIESAIFMMTSRFEGWGLTLTEAQQFGCIPIAFDTYSSLHDIIEGNQNGYIIPWQDEYSFYLNMKELMTDENLRVTMAKSAIDTSKQFAINQIIDQWEEIMMKGN